MVFPLRPSNLLSCRCCVQELQIYTYKPSCYRTWLYKNDTKNPDRVTSPAVGRKSGWREESMTTVSFCPNFLSWKKNCWRESTGIMAPIIWIHSPCHSIFQVLLRVLLKQLQSTSSWSTARRRAQLSADSSPRRNKMVNFPDVDDVHTVFKNFLQSMPWSFHLQYWLQYRLQTK